MAKTWKTFKSQIYAGTFGLPERIADGVDVEATVRVRSGEVQLLKARFVESDTGDSMESYLKSMRIDLADLRKDVEGEFLNDPAGTMWEFAEGWTAQRLEDCEEQFEELCVALGADGPVNDLEEFEELFR